MTESTRTLEITTPSDTEIVMRREFDAPRELVFEAFTKPEHITRWLGWRGDTMPVCEVDLRVGGKYRYVWSLSDGGEMGLYGEFLEIDPPSRIVQTENFDEPYFEAMGSGTVITLTLEERDGKTLMTETIACKSREARDGIIATGMESGVVHSFERLDELLATMK